VVNGQLLMWRDCSGARQSALFIVLQNQVLAARLKPRPFQIKITVPTKISRT
jgi:hypothetical protein